MTTFRQYITTGTKNKTDKRPDFCRKDKEVRGYYGIRKGNDLHTVWLEAEERRTESAPDLSEYDV
jgi:hypothetical protein